MTKKFTDNFSQHIDFELHLETTIWFTASNVYIERQFVFQDRKCRITSRIGKNI